MYDEDSISMFKVFGIIFLIIGIAIGFLAFFGSFYTIQTGEKGVLLTFGKAESVPINEGLHFKIPFVQSIVKFNTKTMKYDTIASSASKDLQVVSTNITTNFHIIDSEVYTIFKNIGTGYIDIIIKPAEQEIVKATTAEFTAEELITKREQARMMMKDRLGEKLLRWNIVIDEVSITDFDFSDSFNNAIESKVTAEQLKLKADRDLLTIKVEAEQAKVKAMGLKEAKIAEAEGNAQSIKLIDEQLKKSPQYIEYYKLQKWDGALSKVVTSNSVTPLISVN
jgi:prohibitin 2